MTGIIARGVVTAIAPEGGHIPVQCELIKALYRVHPSEVEPITLQQFALGVAQCSRGERQKIFQLMLLGALVLQPLPRDVAHRVERFGVAMGVCDPTTGVVHRFAAGLKADRFFEGGGYLNGWGKERSTPLHTSEALDTPWQSVVKDEALARRWRALGELPRCTLGRRMWEFYTARGFQFPGLDGSAPPLLAQHDWVHIVAEYGTRVESELEVFAFIAFACDDFRAFSLFAMVVSLFETGHLEHGAGLFEAFPCQMSREGIATRVADAIRRGVMGNRVDYMALDWFELAHIPVVDIQRRFGIQRKHPYIESPTPWGPGGISEYQDRQGRLVAERDGREYDPFGVTL